MQLEFVKEVFLTIVYHSNNNKILSVTLKFSLVLWDLLEFI